MSNTIIINNRLVLRFLLYILLSLHIRNQVHIEKKIILKYTPSIYILSEPIMYALIFFIYYIIFRNTLTTYTYN